MATAIATISAAMAPSPARVRSQMTASAKKREARNTTAAPNAASTSSSRTMRCARVLRGPGARRPSIHDPYSATKVCSACGSLRSTQAENGPEARIIQGVVNAVTAETLTATG